MSTWLITGCSTGLGRALAESVLRKGDNAVLTARDAVAVQELADAYPQTALPLSLDVTNPEQVASAAKQAEERFGAVDVLVNNAGYGYRAAIEEGDDADIARLFATNVFGPVSMMKAVLPGMRARRSGAIVNISSIGVHLCPPGSGYYAASKAALEGLSSSAQKEVEPLGITVTTVEPGAFRTDFAGRSLTQVAEPIADYAETAGTRRKEHDKAHGTQPGNPEKAAEAIIAAVEAERTPRFLLLGQDALKVYREIAEARANEIALWEPVSSGTGFGA